MNKKKKQKKQTKKQLKRSGRRLFVSSHDDVSLFDDITWSTRPSNDLCEESTRVLQAAADAEMRGRWSSLAPFWKISYPEGI